jgi:hypothetical protein
MDSTNKIRKALAAGHTINPRVIAELADKLDDLEGSLAVAVGERDRLAADMARVEESVSKMPKRKDYISRSRAWHLAIEAGFLGFLIGGVVAIAIVTL